MSYRVVIFETKVKSGQHQEGITSLYVGITRSESHNKTLPEELPNWVRESIPVVRNDLAPKSVFKTRLNARSKKRKLVEKLKRQGFTVNRDKRSWSLYVIELSPMPDSKDDQPAVYVGQTSKTIEERFSQHLKGGFENKASRVVTRRGGKLLHKLIPKQKYYSQADAEAAETRLGNRLQDKGYRVYGPQGMNAPQGTN